MNNIFYIFLISCVLFSPQLYAQKDSTFVIAGNGLYKLKVNDSIKFGHFSQFEDEDSFTLAISKLFGEPLEMIKESSFVENTFMFKYDGLQLFFTDIRGDINFLWLDITGKNYFLNIDSLCIKKNESILSVEKFVKNQEDLVSDYFTLNSGKSKWISGYYYLELSLNGKNIERLFLRDLGD